MEIKDILALTQAGFSKDEIMKMTQTTQPTQPTQTTQQTQPTQPTQPTQQTQQTNTDALLLAINNLTATIQAGNVQATGQNSANKVRTPDDVIDDLMKIM